MHRAFSLQHLWKFLLAEASFFVYHTSGSTKIQRFRACMWNFLFRALQILGQLPRRLPVAPTYDREQIRAALAQNDPSLSMYFDLGTGTVVRIDESDTSAAMEALRNEVMDKYGDRYRYIAGGNSAADDAAVTAWLEAEGL
jgi:hypothetical protein